MNRKTEIELLGECRARTIEKRPFSGARQASVPVAHYTDPDRFRLERERVFRRKPSVVAHSSQIASPGDFLSRDVANVPIVLVRDESGRARAFINVCRHRGAQVELRKQGHCKRLVCPYHAWTYKTDGSLDHIRQPQGFPVLERDNAGLRELACVESHQFIWVCPDPNVQIAELDADTERILSEIEGLGTGDLVVYQSTSREWRANWKLIVDGSLESYHFRVAHKNTLGPAFADNTSTYAFVGDHIRSILPRSSIAELPDTPDESWAIREHANVLYALYPSASVLVQSTHFDIILADPVAIDRTRIEILTVARPPGPRGYSERARAFLDRNHTITNLTLNEDFELAEQIQRGMHSGANEVFHVGEYEGALTDWHRRLEEQLASTA